MDVRTYQGNYLKAADLQGQSVTVKIRSVVEEDVGNPAEKKPVAYFEGKEKGLVLNSTNSNTISDLLGFESDLWLGNAIVLYPAQTEFAGKVVDCIRVKMPASTQAHPIQNIAPSPPPTSALAAPTDVPPSDEIPF